MTQTVVQYVDSDLFGGCEEMVLTLLDGLVKTRWSPSLFYHHSPGISHLVERARECGVRCRSVPRISRGNVTVTLREFARELKAVEPTVFHAHLNWPLGCRYGIMAARLT